VNCICDDFVFPPQRVIAAGLPNLPRQTGTFAEFRRAMLRAASVRSTAALDSHPLWSLRYLSEPDRGGLIRSLGAIGRWRARHPEDFGIMLLEMWAYVCNLTSFYDEVLANEAYVRTARRRESLRRLVDPLGYIPRPAVAALVDLAAFAEGRRLLKLPAETAFRSGAFGGNPPQVFELGAEASIHPLWNEWAVLPVRPVNLPVTSSAQMSLLCRPGTVTVKANDLVLAVVNGSPQPRLVTNVADYTGTDGEQYVRVSFASSLIVTPNSQVTQIRLLKPSAIASQWKLTENSESAIGSNYVYLDGVNRQIRGGQYVILEGNAGHAHALTVDRNEDDSRTVRAAGSVTFSPTGSPQTSVSVPAVKATVSKLVFTANIDSQVASATPHIAVHYGFVEAGAVTVEALSTINRTDPLDVRVPVELAIDSQPPGRFQFEDKNGSGLTRPGSMNFATGHFSVQGDAWPYPLVPTVRLFGNVLTASRGETVKNESLGSGDTATANQHFTLKKSPLTYLPFPSGTTPSGLTSTLKVYVDGVQWAEVPSFYGYGPQEQIYVVRQNDKGESVVIFGDGVLGRRLETGAQVTAYYRFGGGAAMPPAASVTQLAKPFPGLRSVRSPAAPYGGADAEPASGLRKYAPRSALLLGRAVSLADLEAAAASYSGVRAVAAEWRWSTTLQVPAAHIWYLAGGDITQLILNQLRSLTQPDTPIQVEPATSFTVNLSIQLTASPKYFESDVLTAARKALMDVETGLLPPERLGIGKPLFRSQLFEALLKVPGVDSVTGLTYAGLPFSEYGVKPDAGRYFDFSTTLYLNGRNA